MNGPAIIAGTVLGIIVGSFIATLCIRWPRREQVLLGRSHCDGCGRGLGARDLVPLVSAFIAGGACRTCGVAIDPLHRQLELGAGAIGGMAMAIAPGPSGAALAIFCWLLLPLAILDARHFWLPDKLTLLLGATGLAAGHFVSGASLADRAIGSAIGFASMTSIAVVYRRFRGRVGLGAGDAKLLAAIGAWTGWIGLPPILLLASLTGLAVAAIQGKSATDMVPFGSLLAVGAALWAASSIGGAGLAAVRW